MLVEPYGFPFEANKKHRTTEGCSKLESPETRQVQERLVSTLEHLQVPKWESPKILFEIIFSRYIVSPDRVLFYFMKNIQYRSV